MKRLYLILLLAFAVQAMSAQSVCKGTITDSDGEPMIGVSIYEKGTTRGTVTDASGSYSIDCGADATLVFSYVGYATQEIMLEGRMQLDVVLLEGITLADLEIVGSRSLNRSVTASPVAIDIIDIREVTNSVGQLDLNQLLQFAAPSFNANRQSGADGADHVDPATLRGLGPDQTLVLVNGKRRHQSSLVNLYGTRGRGNTGTDLNSIPAAAIERIEILRDGASAQYGSDAIAGVINIVLKSSTDEFSGNVNLGAHKATNNGDRSFDGENLQLNGNYGFKVGDGGFVNVTADYWDKGRTNRRDPGLYRQQFGDAQATNFGAYFNSRIPISKKAHFYAFGGTNFRKTDAFAWTRDPGSARNVLSIYPNGFDPHIVSDITDKSMSAGIRGDLNGWDVDFNHTVGSNRFHYYGEGTLNASLEERSPTRFDDGGFALSQATTSLDFTRYFKNTLKGVNVAYGLEYRVDRYEIFAGEEGSWQTYGPVVFTVEDGDTIYRPGGSQGFPGFSPANEVNESRTNLGAYLDTEFDLTDRFMVGAALRFEEYSDFGNTFNGKIAARLQVANGLALRASASTGFRAPSLAQIHFNSIFTDFVSGVAVDKFLARNNSPITRQLGIPELKQERSVNASAGMTFNSGSFSLTVDGYYVKVEDRIVLTGDFTSDDPDIGQELQAINVGSARFFTNAVNTSTTGADIILAYVLRLGNGHRFSATIAANVNDMKIDKVNTTDKLKGKEDIYFSNRERLFLLASAPNTKGNLALEYKTKRLSANARLTYFDKITLEDYVGALDEYKAATTLDLSVSLELSRNLRLTIGGANILDAYPTIQDVETESGGRWDSVQMGFNGAFYFTRIGFKF